MEVEKDTLFTKLEVIMSPSGILATVAKRNQRLDKAPTVLKLPRLLSLLYNPTSTR